MSLTRSIGRNTIIQFGGKIFGTIIGLVTIGLIQRYLQPAGFGAYTTAMAYLGFFSVIADLGLYLILIRELAKPAADEARVVGNLLGLRWTSAFFILAAGAAAVWLFPYPAAVKTAVLIGAVSFVAVAATQLLVGVFQTKMAMGRVAGAELAGRLVLLGATMAAVGYDGGLSWLMTAVVGGSLVNLLLVWWSARRYLIIRLRFELAYWGAIIRETLPIAVSVILNLIYFRADTIILSLFHSQYDVGLYGAAYKILEILNTFPIMFVGLILPVLGAAYAANQPERFRQVFQRSFDLLLMAIVPLVVGGWILAEPLLVAIGQSNYAPAAPVLRLLLFAVAALYLNSLSGHAVTMINRQRQMVWGYLSVAAVGLVLYFSLIPRFSLYGAAWGTIITESLSALIGYVLVTRVMGFRIRFGAVGKILLAGLVMAAALYYLHQLNFWLTLSAGAVVYLLTLMAAKAFPWSAVKEIINNRPGPAAPPVP